MDPELTRDLIERLSSRKFLLCVLLIILALAGFLTGNLDYSQFINAALTIAGIFMGAEGIADAAGALKPKPPTVTNVTVDSTPAAPPAPTFHGPFSESKP